MAADVADDRDLDRALGELAGLLFSGQDTDTTLYAVATLARDGIPGCDAASVTLIDGRGVPSTPVSTDDVALVLDEAQYASDKGPCLSAVRTRQVVHVESINGSPEWPEFAVAAKGRSIASSLSLPLTVGEEVVGALNLYAGHIGGFVGAEEAGTAFARQAGVTLANAQALFRAEQLGRDLTEALTSRDVIGQAKGILMATENLSSDAAFDVLRRASQRANRKLRDVAQELVDARNSHTQSHKS
jgi:GAF domain-containing protein